MSLTIPVYSHNPWDLVYSPLQLDFQKVASEDNPTGQDHQITTDRFKRISIVALSFASLYSPVGRAISLCMDLHKSIFSMKSLVHGTDNKARALLDLTLAVVSASGTIFKHRIGLAIPAGQEAILNGYALMSSLWTGDALLAIESSLFLANNSLYIATLFYCSLEIVFISLVLQAMVQCYKAYGEFEKGNNLGGFAHLVMGVIRNIQAFPLGEILLVKWLIKADVETWKENLSPHENAVKEKLGMKYLYFKKGDKREKFLILSAQSDHNGTLDPSNRIDFLKDNEKLNKRFDVKFRTISRVEDIKTEIELAAQTGKVTGLLLRAHGNPDCMVFGSDPECGTLWQGVFPAGIFSKLDLECIMGLFSCKTAAAPNSIAYKIASESQRVTYAPGSLPNYMRLSSLKPLAWRFSDSSNVEMTKIIIPNPLSNLSDAEQTKITIPTPRAYTTENSIFNNLIHSAI